MLSKKFYIGIFALLLALTNTAESGQPFIVKTIYFKPLGANHMRDSEIEEIVKYARDLYADEMERNGFDRKTFIVESDRTDSLIVHRVNGNKTAQHYRNNTLDTIMEEMPNEYKIGNKPDEVHLIIIGGMGRIDNNANYGTAISFSLGSFGGTTLVAANTDDFGAKVGDVVFHELGHCFGLSHKPEKMNPKVSALEHFEARWLDKSYHFNDFQHNFTTFPASFSKSRRDTIKLSATHENTIKFEFEITHTHGLHQAMLTENGTFKNSDYLNGEKKDTVRFEMPREEWAEEMSLFLIDTNGNYHYYVLQLSLPDALPAKQPDSAQIDADVNDDGYVDIHDVMIVRSGMQKSVSYDTDINNDGVTDEIDVLIVKAKAFEAIAAAAPKKRNIKLITWSSMKIR